MYNEKIRSQILEESLSDFPGRLSGIYRGYHVSIQNRNAQFLERQKAVSRELLKVDVFPYMAVLSIKGPNLAKNIPSVINENLMPVFGFLSDRLRALGYHLSAGLYRGNRRSSYRYLRHEGL